MASTSARPKGVRPPCGGFFHAATRCSCSDRRPRISAAGSLRSPHRLPALSGWLRRHPETDPASRTGSRRLPPVRARGFRGPRRAATAGSLPPCVWPTSVPGRRAALREPLRSPYGLPAGPPKQVLSLCSQTPPCVISHSFSPQFGVQENPRAREPRLLTTHLWSQKGAEHVGYYYRPVFSLWLLILHTFGGLSSWSWHLSSVVLHTIASYFVYRLCWELLENAIAASCAALFFAIHPIHIESVCWISASNEILYTIFFLSSVLIFAHGIRTPPPQRLWLSVGVLSAALFSQETAIALLPIFPLLGFSRGHWDGWRARLRVALHMGTPYLVPAVIYLAVRWLVLRGVGVEIGKHSWQQVFCSSPSLLLFYFKKLAWPVRLSGFYLNPLVSRPSSEMWLTLLPILAGVVLLAWLAVRYSRCIGLAGCLILLPLIPALAATRVYDQGNIAHDRYLYLPSVGFSLLFGLSATN